ncbi:hypothetical protein CPB84DRAFT_1787718 [Gymnopilus junonius]|uniref:F-box domain-containing protein n=1 Tax=Gymnopilus junonius TaxID=109634 RepID=A0A9P5TJU3_GYMJU|nr:hypothetical protein CPB84DRAFT_1787718 [Gymnopilus junonius]
MQKAKQKIVDAEQQVNDILKEHRELLPKINQIHDPISRLLPPEIISSVFQFCIPHIPFDTNASADSDVDEVWADVISRLSLGAVCHGWRRVAWSTPQLWQYVLINLDVMDLRRNVKVIREWLGRSCKLPLAIRMYSYEIPEESTELYDAISMINRESSRWQMLDLRVSSWFTSRFIGDPEESGLSILQSLRLENAPYDYDVGFQRKNTISRPNNVFLTRVRYKTVVIQWDSVTWVEAEEFYLRECLELLRNAPQIRHCRLSDLKRSRNRFWRFHSLELLHELLSQVNFPSLKRLVIEGAYGYHASDALVSFFKRSSCCLEVFIVVDTLYTSNDVLSVLEEVPSVIELELTAYRTLLDEEGNHSPQEFFKRLARASITKDVLHEEGKSSTFLPNLQILQFTALHSFPWDLLPSIFGPISELDKPHRRHLKSFHLHLQSDNHSGPSTAVIDKQSTINLVAIMKAGVDLKIGRSEPGHNNVLIDSINYHGIPYNWKIS